MTATESLIEPLQEVHVNRVRRAIAAALVIVLMVVILAYTGRRLLALGTGAEFLFIYTATVGAFVVSRFVLAAFYRAPKDVGFEPSISIIVPAYN